MKSIRKSTLFKGNQRSTERKSVVGAFQAFSQDIFRDRIWYPHEEMEKCVQMYDHNSLTQSAVNTMKDFIKGGEIKVISTDKVTKIRAQAYINELCVDSWIDEVIENTIKTGNAYLEVDFKDTEWKHPWKCYPIADSSRIYINCDEYGLPKKTKVTQIDPITKEPRIVEIPNESEYYIQRLDPAIRSVNAKWYDMSYYVGSHFHTFRIYGIPIHLRKMIHFRLNLGNTGMYGRSYIAACLDDWESLKQIERSIAVIAKYKAVPRDILTYGDKDNPATDDEVDEFIIYLESLEKEESAIVNKPVQRQSLSYAGQDINLDYMIQHIKRKMIAGIAPEFMMGMGDQINKATAQISLISYILAIFSKRKLFLRPIEKYILDPFLKREGLKAAHLEFGELDFETKSEKANRIGALWTTNVLTLNRCLELLGEPTIGDSGDVYYIEWQQSLSGGSDFGFPTFGAPGGLPPLPNGEPGNKIFSHNPAPNRNPAQGGGKLPFEPYQKKTDVPKLIPKKQLQKLYNLEMPESYNLESTREYKEAIGVPKHDGSGHGSRDNKGRGGCDPDELKDNEDAMAKKIDLEEGTLPYEWDIDPSDKKKKKWKRIWIGNTESKKETLKIIIDEDKVDNLKVKQIDFGTLIGEFDMMFNEPRQTEIYYKYLDNGWRISFIKNGVLIFCDATYYDILEHYGNPEEMSDEEIKGFIIAWKNKYLMKAIKEI